jgi:tetratricopeptide (TPR) repeat protein
LLGLFLVTAVFIWLATKPQEPSYEGESLSDWLTRAVENGISYRPEAPHLAQCREAIRAIGTNAIPPLIRILRAKDSPVKMAVISVAERQSYVKIPLHSVEEQKERALAGFYLLGDLATNAVPALIDIWRQPSSHESKEIAETTLMRLYPAKCVSVPYWVAAEKQAEWYINLGMLQSASGYTTNALLAFSQAVEQEPTNLIAYTSRGGTKLELLDFNGARLDYEKVLQLAPTNEAGILGCGFCKYGLKDFRGAEADFTRVINVTTNDSRVYRCRGLARANLRKFDAAADDFSKAIELTAYDAELFRNRAMVEGMQTDYESALEDASKSLELNSQDAVTWELRGRIHIALRDYHAAITNENKAIQLSPMNSSHYAARATAYVCMNEYSSAAADLETALRLNPKNANAVMAWGVLREKRGGEEAAPETHGMLGLFQYKASKWEPALENCRKALELGAIVSVSSYNSYIWLIRAQSGEEKAANKELAVYLNSLDATKTSEWSAITARFLSGGIPESNFLALATTALKRPSALTNQVCESYFYAAMKRKLAGDKQAARELLQKCLDTKDDNSMAFMNAGIELRVLSTP